jgi:hypothetical protein
MLCDIHAADTTGSNALVTVPARHAAGLSPRDTASHWSLRLCLKSPSMPSLFPILPNWPEALCSCSNGTIQPKIRIAEV